MPTIEERRQRLVFKSSWNAFKWDASDEFVHGMSQALNGLPADGVKAADVVGIRSSGKSEAGVVFIGEFKDFEHPHIPLSQRARAIEQAESAELRRDITRKVIDTLSGVTFAHGANGTRREELNLWRNAIATQRVKLLVLVCIEMSKPAIVSMLTNDLRRRLRWLGPEATVLVTSSATPFSGMGISYQI